MRTRFIFFAATMCFCVMAIMPSLASAATESGTVSKWPWSGYWWPMLNTDLNLYDNGQSMQLYDQYLLKTTGTAGRAQAWEKANHFTDDASNDWWGHCHAWAAASILAPEPQSTRTVSGVTFGGDQLRGLVTELYYQPKFSWLAGTRADSDDTTTAAYRDIAPVWMDYLLRYYVRYYKYPFIMDISADSQVWNFSIIAFSRNSTAIGNGNENVTTTVWYSNPVAHVTGTKYFSRTYTYTMPTNYSSSGTWTGNSVKDHPDFAWVPTGKNAMPHLDAAKVATIEGQGV